MPCLKLVRPSHLLRALALGLLTLVAPAASLTAAVGCQVCHDDVCSSRLAVILGEPGGGPLQEGQYVLSLTVDGTLASATCDIGPGAASASCTDLDTGALSTPLHDSEDNPHETLNLNWEGSIPTTLTIRVEHDGAVVLDRTFAPDYQPDTDSCDADCEFAIETLSLDR